MDNMTRLELMLVLKSIKALIDTDNLGKAKEIIDELIEEAESNN